MNFTYSEANISLFTEWKQWSETKILGPLYAFTHVDKTDSYVLRVDFRPMSAFEWAVAHTRRCFRLLTFPAPYRIKYTDIDEIAVLGTSTFLITY
jgi:hypothetical protein